MSRPSSSDRSKGRRERQVTGARVDAVVSSMMAAITRIQNSEGSVVKLTKGEVELLEHIELARDMMLDVLRNQNDRSQLQSIFGGDCSRIASIQAICEGIRFSEMNQGDQRLPTCLRACQSVAKVVEDLGEGEALRKAHSVAIAAISERNDLPSRAESAANPLVESASVLRTQSDSVEELTRDVLSLVQAEVDRILLKFRDEHMRTCTDNSPANEEPQQLASSEPSFEARLRLLEDQVSRLDARLGESEETVRLVNSTFMNAETRAEQARHVLESEAGVINFKLIEERTRVDQVFVDVERRITSAEAAITVLQEEQLRHRSEAEGSCSQRNVDDALMDKQVLLEDRFAALDRRLSSHTVDIERLSVELSDLRSVDLKSLALIQAPKERGPDDFVALREELLRDQQLLQVRLSEHCETRVSESISAMRSEVDGKLAEVRGAGEQYLALEVDQLRSSLTEKIESCSEDMARMVKSTKTIDALWDSFAHVGTLVKDLQRQLDELSRKRGHVKTTL